MERYQRQSVANDATRPLPNFRFNDNMVCQSSPGLLGGLISMSRRLLNPFLKLHFSPQPIVASRQLPCTYVAASAGVPGNLTTVLPDWVDFSSYTVIRVVNRLHRVSPPLTGGTVTMSDNPLSVSAIIGNIGPQFDGNRNGTLEGPEK